MTAPTDPLGQTEARAWAAELLGVPDDAPPRAVIAAAERIRRHLGQVVSSPGRRRDLAEAVALARDTLLGLPTEPTPVDVVIHVPEAVSARLSSLTSGWRQLWWRHRPALLMVAWVYAVGVTALAVLMPPVLAAVLTVQGVVTVLLVVAWRLSGATSPLARTARVVTAVPAAVVGLVVASAAIWLAGVVAPVVGGRAWLRSRWSGRPRRRRWTPVERWVLGGPAPGEVWELRPRPSRVGWLWEDDDRGLVVALGGDLFVPLFPDQGQVTVAVEGRPVRVDLRLAQDRRILGCLVRRVGRLDDRDLELLAEAAEPGAGAVVDLSDHRWGGRGGEPPDGDPRRWLRGA